MKVCHICEKVVRLQKANNCNICKSSVCFLCIHKHLNSTIQTNEKENSSNQKQNKCFVCIRQCRCSKCTVNQNIICIIPSYLKTQSQQQINKQQLLNQDDLTSQVGLFKGKKINQLPIYLQRIYIKKKVLYTKHELSCPQNDKNISQAQNIECEDKINKNQDQKCKQAQQSIIQNNQDFVLKQDDLNQQKNQEAQQQNAQDFQSQYPNRRAEHLQNQDNSGINDADVEEDQQEGENGNEQQRESSIADNNQMNDNIESEDIQINQSQLFQQNGEQMQEQPQQ